MKNFIFGAALTALAATQSAGNLAWGSDYGLNLEHLDMKVGEFLDNRDPYAPQYQKDWTYRVEMNIRFNFAGFLYFDQRPHFEAVDSGTPKTVGWQYELGIHLTDQLDVFKDHHSRHIMEDYKPRVDGHNPFPVEDLYGVKFTVVNNPNAGKSSLSRMIFGN